MKSESIVNLIQATIKVMEEVKGIDKTMTIGTGAGSYKGVPDQEVKKIIGEAMARNGLAIFPIDIEENTQLESWDETGQYGTKRKQSVFTKTKVTYLLTHVSGEYMKLMGYGHGVDSQDKSAGKATTYALKYALLYTFLVPTGKIDDTDNTHSDDIKTPEPKEKNEESILLVSAAEMLNKSTSLVEVKRIWDLHPKLWKNKVFQKMVNEAKQKFTPKEN